jgi:hypothetical protein
MELRIKDEQLKMKDEQLKMKDEQLKMKDEINKKLEKENESLKLESKENIKSFFDKERIFGKRIFGAVPDSAYLNDQSIAFDELNI